MSKKRTPKIPSEAPHQEPAALGSRLREAREGAGLTPALLHEKTRVPVEAITALEEERFEALPAAVYTRGFVKLLCAELGLPYHELAAQLPTTGPTPSPASLSLLDLPTHASREAGDKEEEKQSRVSTALVLFILVVIASLAISYFASQKERESLQSPSASETTHLDVTG